MVEVKIKKINENARVPQKMHKGDSGYDLYSVESLVIDSEEIVTVSTGIAVEVPYGYEMQVRSRSGLAYKNGIFVLNSPGTIDSNYRGEVKVILMNAGKSSFRINYGDRIAQAVFIELPEVKLDVVSQLSASDRGSGGLGHTGVQ